MNPPYQRRKQGLPGIVDWIQKAWEESQRGALVVSLVPVDTSTGWWRLCENGQILFIHKRIQFVGTTGSPPLANALAIFYPFMYPFHTRGLGAETLPCT
jgi:DNA N-6-adenine-methyltransferase Dam